MVLESITAGSVLGWSWLFPPYRWTFGAVVAVPGQALVFDAPEVRRLMAEDAALGRELNAGPRPIRSADGQAVLAELLPDLLHPFR